jgi:hypothetical protein
MNICPEGGIRRHFASLVIRENQWRDRRRVIPRVKKQMQTSDRSLRERCTRRKGALFTYGAGQFAEVTESTEPAFTTFEHTLPRDIPSWTRIKYTRAQGRNSQPAHRTTHNGC